jgi:TIR domain
MPRIAISYRRADSAAITGRVADRLVGRYGKDSIFIDIDNVPVGSDFRKSIAEAWSRIDVLLVVIGPRWLGIGEDGGPADARIRDRKDVVRLEVELALERDVPIIPILVDGATMPSAQQLPKSLRAFTDRNAAEVNGGRDFHPHVDRLIREIDRIVGEPIDHASEAASKDVAPIAHSTPARGSSPPADQLARLAWSIAFPIFVLVVLHHLIVNALDLDSVYLRAVSLLVPLPLGMLAFRQARWAPTGALVAALSVGLVSVAAMSISQGLSSGRPIMPATAFEWREAIEYVVSIASSFFIGCLLARWLAARPRKVHG